MKNIEFEKATNAEKRIMIARDVITQLHAEKYIPQSVYVEFRFRFEDDDPCMCCGIGACMISTLRLTEKSKREFISSSHQQQLFWGELLGYFGNDQLALIEEFFERPHAESAASDEHYHRVIDSFDGFPFGGKYTYSVNYDEFCRIREVKLKNTFGDRDSRLDTRGRRNTLIQIMENIIRNGGTFDPFEEMEFQKKMKPSQISTDLDEHLKSFREIESNTQSPEVISNIQ